MGCQETEPIPVLCRDTSTPTLQDERIDSNDSEDRDMRDDRVPRDRTHSCLMSGCQEWIIHTSKIVIILEIFEANYIQRKHC